MSNIGFRVYPLRDRPEAELVEQFRGVVTPHISDNLHRMHSAPSELRPFHQSGQLLGVAFTVRTRPGDNLLVHKAIDMAEPNDVIVVDAGGDLTNAIAGEIMMRLAMRKGIAGFVIDGAIRDTAAFASDRFPVYARGITHRGPYKDGPGEINVPISLGGMVVHPGDIIVGDEDGIVAVPQGEARNLLVAIRAQQQHEETTLRAIAEGKVNRDWVDRMLRDKGCELA